MVRWLSAGYYIYTIYFWFIYFIYTYEYIYIYIYIYFSTLRSRGTLAQNSATLVNGPTVSSGATHMILQKTYTSAFPHQIRRCKPWHKIDMFWRMNYGALASETWFEYSTDSDRIISMNCSRDKLGVSETFWIFSNMSNPSNISKTSPHIEQRFKITLAMRWQCANTNCWRYYISLHYLALVHKLRFRAELSSRFCSPDFVFERCAALYQLSTSSSLPVFSLAGPPNF